jgi:hypothetical protein
MKPNHHETIEEAKVELPSDRSTGLVLSAAALVAAMIWHTEPAILIGGLALCGLLSGLSFATPAVLHPLNRAWMGLGRLIGQLASPLVMLVLFCTIIVPFGLAMQLKRDPLRRRPTEADETFWIVPEIQFGPNDMTRQF